jgi:Uncharacterized protein conserved in bacteria (DUF2252)
MLDIYRSTKRYEAWLRKALGGSLMAKALQRKHKKMRKDAFSFLRATYWRWAETVLEACPDLASAPSVLAVGDIHLENFGTWRDAEGRLIWGINDFDEAAEMPYALDLVRLATSALLADLPRQETPARIAGSILRGYREGLAAPSPIVLDREFVWLRRLAVVSESQRRKFWEDIHKNAPQEAPPPYRQLLTKALPPQHRNKWTARRTAGSGSLGRPRWIAVAEWRGGEVVREAKAQVMSAWNLAHGGGAGKPRGAEIANGRYRVCDPYLAVEGSIVVRRLSPNNRKIEADDPAFAKVSAHLLRMMGRELANAHLGVRDRRRAIQGDFGRRKPGWLARSAQDMAAATRRDFEAYRAVKP